jgi:alcohol dehydrogenase (cytochrome c)/quinohemoprotein ethanol dehydrogenase
MGEFNAYNAATGAKLWSAPTQARAIAAPSTFTVDGQQEVALLVGARGLPENAIRTNPQSGNNSRLLVFKIGAKGSLPTSMPPGAVTARMKIDPPLLTAPTETVLSGEQAFAANCAVCHGANAVPGAGSSAPDLRYSGILPLPFTWNLTVRDGDRAARGMPAFGTVLSKDTTDSILAYVIKRANDEKAVQEAATKKR